MFDYSNIPMSSSDDDDIENDKKDKLDINLLLEKIDTADYNYYNSLSDKEKKLFAPYIILRWVSSLDDSLQVTYSAKKIESVFSKWSDGGKEVLNELKDEFNQSDDVNCMSVSKYEHAKYDWRIKFSVKNEKSANKLIELLSSFGISGHEIVYLTDSLSAKYHLSLLNNLVNVDFWSISEHPELSYQLMCSVSSLTDKVKRTHSWLPFCQGLKNVDNDIYEIIKKTQSSLTASQLNEFEYRILLMSYDNSTFMQLLEDLGISESERKSLMKKFKMEYEKYGKYEKRGE